MPINRDELGFILHAPGMPEAINADSFDEDVLQSPVPTVIEFWAARCGPCRRLAPEMAAAATEVGNRCRLFTLNVDDEPEAAHRFAVPTIPATLLFVDGIEKARHYGWIDRASLVNLLRPYMAPHPAPLGTGENDD